MGNKVVNEANINEEDMSPSKKDLHFEAKKDEWVIVLVKYWILCVIYVRIIFWKLGVWYMDYSSLGRVRERLIKIIDEVIHTFDEQKLYGMDESKL